MKKSILLIIDNLSKGGAEVLLTGILPALNERYSVILVTLTHECDFSDKEILCEERYILGFNHKFSVFKCVWRLKKIIRQHRPLLIHSHLFYSSLIARIACPHSIPLIYSLHNEMSKNVFNNSKVLTRLEKLTIKKNHAVIAVSKEVLKDYENTIKKNSFSFILPNYISDAFFNQTKIERNFTNLQKIKLVAVGNIKDQKNYNYLINAFKLLKDCDISVDIYGRGKDKDVQFLQNKVSQSNLSINFKGPANQVQELLPLYDMFVCCSTHEGFGIAAIEAMAEGLPLLLSDLPVLREVTFNNALFFDVTNPLSFVSLIKEIFKGKHDLGHFSHSGIAIAKRYKKDIYIKNLFHIYDTITNVP